MSEPIDIQTLRAAALTSEELLRRLTAEMIALDTSGAGMRLDIGCPTAFAVVAMCQLALKHPQANLGPSADLIRDFIEMIRAKFEPHAPAIALAIERGNDPQHDAPADIPPEAFGGKRPPADELRFYRLIDEKYKSEDGIEDVKLACGHLMSYPASLPPSQKYAYCLTCFHAWHQAEPAEMEEERALLSRLLNSRDPLENARLTFRSEKHRMIFQRIMDLHERGEPVDRVALANELMKNGELQAVGGLSYLVTLYEPPQYDTPRQAEPSSLIEFLANRKEPATPEEIILELLSKQSADKSRVILTCPFCGYSQIAPEALAKIDLYICAGCGRTVETA